jgi:hypothetical protein
MGLALNNIESKDRMLHKKQNRIIRKTITSGYVG